MRTVLVKYHPLYSQKRADSINKERKNNHENRQQKKLLTRGRWYGRYDVVEIGKREPHLLHEHGHDIRNRGRLWL